MTREYLRTEPSERVDAPDFKRGTTTSLLESQAEFARIFKGSDATLAGYVFDGLGITNTSGKVVTVASGVALLALRHEGRTYNSVVGVGGVATSKAIDVTAYPAGTYSVYVRATLRPASFDARNFWETAVPPSIERARGIPTRYIDDWDIAIEQTSPGAEWMKLGTISQAALNGTGAGITDTRVWYFEGELVNNYDPTSDWGSGNDRNVDRASYGVKGFRRFARAVQAQLQDIIGTDWYTQVIAGGSLQDKLARAGGAGSTVTGVIRPDGSVTRDLGTTATRFLSFFARYLYARNIVLGDLELSSYALSILPRIYAAYSDTIGRPRMQLLLMEKDSSPAGSDMRVYAAKGGYGGTAFVGGPFDYHLEFAFNCQIDASNEWLFGDSALDAVVYAFTRGGLVILRRPAGSATPWADDGTAWDIETRFEIGASPSVYTTGSMQPDLGVTIPAAQTYAYNGAKTVRRAIVASTGVPGNASGWTNLNPLASNSTLFQARHLAASGDGAMMYPIYPPNGASIVDAVINLTVAGITTGVIAMNIVAVPGAGGAALRMASADTVVGGDGTADFTVTVDQNNPVNTDTHSYAIWVFSDTVPTSVLINRIEWRFSNTKVEPA